MNVLVILVNWKGWRDTLACVDSVLRHTPGSVHVAVCDNGSPDDSLQQLRAGWQAQGTAFAECGPQSQVPALSAHCRVLLVPVGANLGFAGGCNVGLRMGLQGDYTHLWLLNNDTVIDEQTLPALQARLAQDPSIGICGSTLIYHDHRDMVQAWGGATYEPSLGMGAHLGVGQHPSALPAQQEVERQMAYVVGASMFVPRHFVEQIGLLREDYFLYYEEIDWAERARGRFKMAWAPDSRVFHKEGASIGSSHIHRPSDLSLHYLYRNRLRFTQRFHPDQVWSVRRRVLREVVSYLRRKDLGACRIIARSLWHDLTEPVPT